MSGFTTSSRYRPSSLDIPSTDAPSAEQCGHAFRQAEPSAQYENRPFPLPDGMTAEFRLKYLYLIHLLPLLRVELRPTGFPTRSAFHAQGVLMPAGSGELCSHIANASPPILPYPPISSRNIFINGNRAPLPSVVIMDRSKGHQEPHVDQSFQERTLWNRTNPRPIEAMQMCLGGSFGNVSLNHPLTIV